MYPLEYDVTVRGEDGEERAFKLLDVLSDRYLVLIAKEHEEALLRFVAAPAVSDEEIDLLADEALVVDGQRGAVLGERAAIRVLRRSEQYALRLAAHRLETELPELHTPLTGADLATAFHLEIAKRRRSDPGHEAS